MRFTSIDIHLPPFTVLPIALVMISVLAGCEPRQPSLNIIEAVGRKHYSLREVEMFLDEDPKAIDETNDFGQRPLQIVSLKGRTRAVELLLDHGANVNATDDDRRTALHSASHAGETESAIRLLDAKAQVNVEDKNGKIPLHDVVEWSPGDIELVHSLIESGADVNAKTNDGETPLDLVIRRMEIYAKPSKHRRRSFDLQMIQQYEAVEEVLKIAMAEIGN